MKPPSQADRQLSLLRRRVASYHSLTGYSPAISCCEVLEPDPSPGIWRMRSSRLLCYMGSRPPSSQPGVSSPYKRFAAATPVQPGPSHPEGDPASAGPSRRRSYDSPSGSFGHSSRQGSDTPARKRRRLSDDSSADERFAAAAGTSVSWRQPYAFAPDQPTSNSSRRSFRQGG